MLMQPNWMWRLFLASIFFVAIVRASGVADVVEYGRAITSAAADDWHTTHQKLANLLAHQDSIYDRADLLFDTGVAAYRTKAFSEAHACFRDVEHCTNVSPECKVQSWFNAGNAAVCLAQYEQAINWYDRVLATDPAHERAQKNRAYAQKMNEQQKKEEEQKQEKQKQEEQKKDAEKNTQESEKKDQDAASNNADQKKSDEEKQDGQPQNKSPGEQKGSADKQSQNQPASGEQKKERADGGAGDQSSDQKIDKTAKETVQPVEQKTAEQKGDKKGSAGSAQNAVSSTEKQMSQADKVAQAVLAQQEVLDKEMHKKRLKAMVARGASSANGQNNW